MVARSETSCGTPTAGTAVRGGRAAGAPRTRRSGRDPGRRRHRWPSATTRISRMRTTIRKSARAADADDEAQGVAGVGRGGDKRAAAESPRAHPGRRSGGARRRCRPADRRRRRGHAMTASTDRARGLARARSSRPAARPPDLRRCGRPRDARRQRRASAVGAHGLRNWVTYAPPAGRLEGRPPPRQCDGHRRSSHSAVTNLFSQKQVGASWPRGRTRGERGCSLARR